MDEPPHYKQRQKLTFHRITKPWLCDKHQFRLDSKNFCPAPDRCLNSPRCSRLAAYQQTLQSIYT
jgi:hypothetical protein